MCKSTQDLKLKKSTIDNIQSHRLTKPTPELYKPLKKFDRLTISKYLNISKNYTCNVLSGYSKPSKALHDKIMMMVSDIKSDESNLMDIVSGDGVAGGDAHLMQEGGLE